MHKTIIVFIFSIVCNYSIAQDTLPAQWNIKASYYKGIQYFSLNSMEETNNAFLRSKMPTTNGFFKYGEFTPSIFHQIEVTASIFKNKTWYIGANVSWGKNETNSYGYIIDANNHLVQYKGRMWYLATFVGYIIKKDVQLKKWGTLQPFVSFYPQYHFAYGIVNSYQVKDEITGQIIEDRQIFKPYHSFYNGYRLGVLMLFDNPKIGIDYSVKLYHHVCLNLRYSYWFANSRINDFYGISKKYVIPFAGSKSIFPSRTRRDYKDMYSHNLSLGLSIQLRK